MRSGNRLEEVAEVTRVLQDESHTAVEMFVWCFAVPFISVGIVDGSGAEGVRLAREKALLALRRGIDAKFKTGDAGGPCALPTATRPL